MPRKSSAEVTAPGVSAFRVGEARWRVVWHDKVPTRRKREFVFLGPDEGINGVRTFASECAAAIGPDGPGMFNPERDRKAAPLPDAGLHALLTACIADRGASGKYKPKTVGTYTAYALRVVNNARIVARDRHDQPLNLPAGAPVPVSSLSRRMFAEIQGRDIAAGSSSMMRYAPLCFLLDAWRWAAAENFEARGKGHPDKWPGLPTPPTSGKDYLPKTPKYRPTTSPTLAHADSCLRHLPPKTTQATRISALFMRFTGLRIGTIMAAQREDIDTVARTMYVREDKEDGAVGRIVPLSAALLSDPAVVGWLSLTDIGPLFPKRNHKRAIKPGTARARHAVVTFREAWEAATAAGEVPRHVWAPLGRANARPEHAFRAAFQEHLTNAPVAADVIDFLVGHEGDATVRSVHYGRALEALARAAVDALQPVDWTGPQTPANVVPFTGEARTANG